MLSIRDIEKKIVLEPQDSSFFEAVLVLSVERKAAELFRTPGDARGEDAKLEAAIAIWAYLYGDLVQDLAAVTEAIASGDVIVAADCFEGFLQRVRNASDLLSAPRKVPPGVGSLT